VQEPRLGSIFTPEGAMNLAMDLAYLGAHRVSPNPMVGCVVLDKSYKLLGYGYHERFGSAHAEKNALANVSKDDIKGAHVFVTLEPCAHQGKTPPCADYLASLPIESLTYGLQDPNPQVAGRGIEVLKAAGIKVYEYQGQDKKRLHDLLDSFLFHLEHKRPFYVLKVAVSLDAMIRDGFGESQWITTEEARTHVHFLRSRFHAVLVGKNTILRDNPKLNVRHEDFPNHRNKVIVINSEADLLNKVMELQFYKIRDPHDVYIVCDKSALQEYATEHIEGSLYLEKQTGVQLLALDFASGLPLSAISTSLYAQGIYNVLVEGGSQIHSYFLENQSFDRLYYYQAHKILGGKDALAWTSQVKFSVQEPLQLSLVNTFDFEKEKLMIFKKS
tara:strand:+ start:17442 stop:18602 length:1161 start_codon:yes stop_codon:yes gene_type:complete